MMLWTVLFVAVGELSKVEMELAEYGWIRTTRLTPHTSTAGFVLRNFTRQ
jgi:hypothetical protein